jgi:hypothetical protein
VDFAGLDHAVAHGKTPKNLRREAPQEPVRTYSNNSVFLVPPAEDEGKDRELCRRTARELADRLFAGEIEPYIDQPASMRAPGKPALARR